MNFAERVRRAASEYAANPVRYFIIPRQGKILVLHFYGDESFGRQGGGSNGCCLFAGYLTDSETWGNLSDEWKSVLDSDPKIDYFRMRDCFALEEEFVRFSRIEADKKLDHLIGVIENFAANLYWVDSILTWDIFTHAAAKASPKLSSLGAVSHPYYFCALAARV